MKALLETMWLAKLDRINLQCDPIFLAIYFLSEQIFVSSVLR